MKNLNKILIAPDATIKEAMKTIDDCGMKNAVITDKSHKLLGIVTDGDIRRGILKGISINEKITKVMNPNPIYASISATKKEIQELFSKTRETIPILGIPLTDDDMIVKDFVLYSDDLSLDYLSSAQKMRKKLHRILIIGGGGYIGSVLVRNLLDKGYYVRVLDKFLYGKESLKSIASHPNLDIVEGDTRYLTDITGAIHDMDAVVHLAELVGDPACALDPKITQEINYFATMMVANVCKHFQINRLIYMSSCSVYGASTGMDLLTETSPLNPVSLYAKLKIDAENALNEMKDSNFRPTIFRLSTVFGFSYRLRFDLVINLLTAMAVREGKISVFGGDQWRPFVHVEDVSRTIIAALEAPIELVGGEIFNVGSEENNYTIRQIGQMIKDNVPGAALNIEEAAIDKRDYKVSFEKLRKTLKIDMTKKVVDGILDIKKATEENKSINYKDPKYNNFKYLEKKNL